MVFLGQTEDPFGSVSCLPTVTICRWLEKVRLEVLCMPEASVFVGSLFCITVVKSYGFFSAAEEPIYVKLFFFIVKSLQTACTASDEGGRMAREVLHFVLWMHGIK